jgi:hypothetical protein
MYVEQLVQEYCSVWKQDAYISFVLCWVAYCWVHAIVLFHIGAIDKTIADLEKQRFIYKINAITSVYVLNHYFKKYMYYLVLIVPLMLPLLQASDLLLQIIKTSPLDLDIAAWVLIPIYLVGCLTAVIMWCSLLLGTMLTLLWVVFGTPIILIVFYIKKLWVYISELINKTKNKEDIK